MFQLCKTINNPEHIRILLLRKFQVFNWFYVHSLEYLLVTTGTYISIGLLSIKKLPKITQSFSFLPLKTNKSLFNKGLYGKKKYQTRI